MSDGGVCLIMFTVLLNVLGQAMWLTGHVYHKSCVPCTIKVKLEPVTTIDNVSD